MTLSFFVAVFTSILWLIYTYFYLGVQLAGNSFETLSISDMAICMFIVFAPFITIWFFWDRIRSLHNEKALNKQISLLSSQVAQNQEYSEIIARILLQTSQQQTKQTILQQTNFYIAEMNEILFDILQRYEFLPEKDIHNIWKNVNLGNRYGFAKAFINLQNSSFIFQNQLKEKTKNQPLLLSSLKEFCSRYTQLITLLKKQDKDKNNELSSAIESGAFGRVFVDFSNIINEIAYMTETADLFAQKQDTSVDGQNNSSSIDQNQSVENFNIVKKFWQKFHKTPEPQPEEKIFPDTLSIALERSFGASEPQNDSAKEPSLSDEIPSVTKHFDSPFYASNNNRTILSLQKEWEELNQNNFSNISKELFANEK